MAEEGGVVPEPYIRFYLNREVNLGIEMMSYCLNLPCLTQDMSYLS